MKLLLLAFLLIVGLTLPVLSQSSLLHVGVRMGGNVSFLSDNFPAKDIKRTHGIGFYGGGFLTIPLNDTWSLQPEVQYCSEVGEYSSEFYRTSDNGIVLGKFTEITRHQVASLRVPLLVRWCSGGYKAGSVGIVAGPVGSYIISVKNHSTMDPLFQIYPSSYDVDFTDNAKQFQFGITAGVEYYLTDHLSMDMRGIYPLTKHLDQFYQASLSSLTVGVGYRF